MTITEPGIVTDLDERTYHADRGSLSHSGSKNLHDSPARFRWLLDNRETAELLAVYDEVKRCRDAGSAPTPASIDLPF